MIKTNYYIISFTGILAVVLGAFGAHALRDNIDEKMMHAYETGIQYHFYHLFAMIFCVLYMQFNQNFTLQKSFYLFLAGIVCFSGSLYGMAFASSSGTSMKFLGPITPLGGVLFILAWAYMFWSVYKTSKS